MRLIKSVDDAGIPIDFAFLASSFMISLTSLEWANLAILRGFYSYYTEAIESLSSFSAG